MNRDPKRTMANRRVAGLRVRDLIVIEGGLPDRIPMSMRTRRAEGQLSELEHSDQDGDAEPLVERLARLDEALIKYAVLDRELQNRLPREVIRMVDALADAARDIARLEMSIGTESIVHLPLRPSTRG